MARASTSEPETKTGSEHRTTQSGSNLSIISSASAGQSDEIYESAEPGVGWANLK